MIKKIISLKDMIETLIKENMIQLKGALLNVNKNSLPSQGNISVKMITMNGEWIPKGAMLPVMKTIFCL